MQAANTRICTPTGRFLCLEDDPIPQDTRTETDRGAAARWDVHTSMHTPVYRRAPPHLEHGTHVLKGA